MCLCQAKPTLFKKVTHCIFDLDGTILDTETGTGQVITDILKRFGKELTPEVRLRTIGRRSIDLWQLLINEYDLSISLEDVIVEFRATCKLVLTDCQLLPGVERLIRHLHQNKVPIAIATSSVFYNVERKTQHVQELMTLFDHICSTVDNPQVKHGKPSPEIYFCCASKFPDKPKPSQCLALEDSPVGLTAAINAGMQCVLINHLLPRELSKDATLFLNSLEEFIPEQFGLPPF